MKIDLIQVTSALGLKSNATVSEITEAINLLKGIDNPQSMINEALNMNLIAKYEVDELHELASANPVVFAKYLDKRKQKVLHDRQEEGLKLVNTAFRDGRLNADGVGKVQDFWLNAFKNDFEGTKTALSQLPIRRSIVSEFLDKDSTDKSTWTLSDYRKKSPKELRENPDLYKRLVEQEKK